MLSKTTIMAAFIAVAAGCAPNSGSAQLAPAALGMVTAEDISLSGGSTALDGVFLLNPGIQTGRAMPELDTGRRPLPVVYLDGARVDYDTLRSVAVIEIEEMRYLDPTEAQMRYGLNHQGGAIVVQTIGRQ